MLLNTICRNPGFNSLRTPLNHGAEQASNETLKQTQQRDWSNASQGGQTALKEHVAVLHYETASTTQQPRGEHRGTIKDCKIAGATTWQGQGNDTFTTVLIILFLFFQICCPFLLFSVSVRIELQWVKVAFQLFQIYNLLIQFSPDEQQKYYFSVKCLFYFVNKQEPRSYVQAKTWVHLDGVCNISVKHWK